MTMNPEKALTAAAWPRPSARDLWYTGSGQPVPSPTDDEIADVIARKLGLSEYPSTRDLLIQAARAVRDLFPQPTVNAVSKDTV